MLEDRVWINRVANNLLAGAIFLVLQTAAAFFNGRLPQIEAPVPDDSPPPGLPGAYLPRLLAGLVARRFRKLSTRREGHWRVAYREVDGPGIAETGQLDGPVFTVLPDDGQRFYADPFLLEHEDRHYLFVEEFPYATGKGVISVSQLGNDGRFDTPRVVLEEPHHLSYPQIIVEDGEIFPDRWVRDTVLLAGPTISDATLFVRDGRYWLVGTEQLELGSSSDAMVVYSAPVLRGPWLPHALNPIVIDRARARPGGLAIAQDGGLTLPVQDGTHTYGGGLGLIDLIRLDDHDVAWGPVRPIGTGPAWDRQGIHTLNRIGRLEVVDSVA
jgi:hypothetical protein